MAMKRSKRYRGLKNFLEEVKDLNEGVGELKKESSVKFDESIDVSIKLNLQKKHTVRDTVSFPNSFGKTKKILAFVKEDKVEEAKKSGADYAGGAEFIEKISKGWLDFDVAIATPSMMRDIAKVARILGSRGLMPNPKTKTVTDDVSKAIREVKGGRKEFRADADGNVNVSIGKKSMTVEAIAENYKEFLTQVIKKKPSDLKGDYIKSIHLSTTMGKSIPLDRKLIK